MDQENEDECVAMKEASEEDVNEDEEEEVEEEDQSSAQTWTNTLFKSNLVNKHLGLTCK